MPRLAQGFGVHRAGAEHGPGLDARASTAPPARSLQNVGCGPASARFRSCQAWPEQELYSFMCRYIYVHMKLIKDVLNANPKKGNEDPDHSAECQLVYI